MCNEKESPGIITIRFVDQGVISKKSAFVEIYVGNAVLTRIATTCVPQGDGIGFKKDFAIPGVKMPLEIRFSKRKKE